MRGMTDIVGKVGTLDAESVFEALCRVNSDSSRSDGPHAVFERFWREMDRQRDTPEDNLRPVSRDAEREREHKTPRDDRDLVMQALLRTLGSYRDLLERYSRDFDEIFERRRGSEEAVEDEDETIRRLKATQKVLVKYPIAAQAVFGALVREGRRFARTEEGRSYARRLAGSHLLGRARTLFEGLTSGFVAEEDGPLPSAFVDAFVRALDRGLEKVLSEIAGAEE